MKNNAFENVANNIIPGMVSVIFYIGLAILVVACIGNIVVRLRKKTIFKISVNESKVIYTKVGILGSLTFISTFIIRFLVSFNADVSCSADKYFWLRLMLLWLACTVINIAFGRNTDKQ